MEYNKDLKDNNSITMEDNNKDNKEAAASTLVHLLRTSKGKNHKREEAKIAGSQQQHNTLRSQQHSNSLGLRVLIQQQSNFKPSKSSGCKRTSSHPTQEEINHHIPSGVIERVKIHNATLSLSEPQFDEETQILLHTMEERNHLNEINIKRMGIKRLNLALASSRVSQKQEAPKIWTSQDIVLEVSNTIRKISAFNEKGGEVDLWKEFFRPIQTKRASSLLLKSGSS